MPYLRTILPAFCLLYFAALASAEDKSFYSPVIQVDKDNHRVLISTLGSSHTWTNSPSPAWSILLSKCVATVNCP